LDALRPLDGQSLGPGPTTRSVGKSIPTQSVGTRSQNLCCLRSITGSTVLPQTPLSFRSVWDFGCCPQHSDPQTLTPTYKAAIARIRGRRPACSSLRNIPSFLCNWAGRFEDHIGVGRARMVENHECRAGLGRPIETVIASIPVPGHCGQDSKSCTKIGEATLPNRERNRPEEGERQNDPIPVRCTPMDRCSKKHANRPAESGGLARPKRLPDRQT